MARPDLLFLSQRLPYPPAKGEKIRAFNELKYLAQRYSIHLGCLIDDPEDRQHIDTLRLICRDIYVAEVNRGARRVASLRGLLSGEALSVTYFRNRGLRNWVHNVLQTVCPAVTFVCSSNMAQYILDTPSTGMQVVDLVDVDSEKWRAFADTTKGPMKFIYWREWRKIASLERRIARQCNVSVFVSEAEAALFACQHLECATRIRGVSNGVDHHYFDPAVGHAPVYDTTRSNFVFTGTMDYAPNADAVAWFATEILPLVRRTLRFAQFHIVGRNPSAAVLKLAGYDGVFVTGRVPDVRPYIAHATACVAPMRIARGIQNKVLEGMAMARAVVLTARALDGIVADPVTEVVLADTASAFAGACCRMATTPDGAVIGAAARRRILCNYDWNGNLSRFDDILRPANSSGPIEAM